MTSQAWPITIGKITFKDRKGPTTDVRRKKAIRAFVRMQADLQSLPSYSKYGKGE
jgi:hypothetical protein